MRITKIAINNWRSIKDLEFCPSDVTAVIGPNNAGKTNILSALNFLLGERWPSSNSLRDTDFYGKDRNRELSISASFDDGPEGIGRIWFSSSDNRAWYSYVGKDKAYPLNGPRRELFPLVYLDAARSYDTTFSVSQWSLFGRIIRELDTHFRASQPRAVQEEAQSLLRAAQDLLRTDLYQDFEASIVKAFADQVRHTSHKVELDFRTFDPLNFYKTLHPVLIEHGVPKSPAEVGSGMRNLIVMALFRAYATILKGGAIIAIEEPEIYLHPHAQRSLASVFEELAGNGSQVLYSTHSSTFVNVAQPDRIVLVGRCEDDEEEVCTRVCTTTAADLLQARRTLHPTVAMTEASLRERYRLMCQPEHADAYFARVVVLVEGATEAAALPVFAAGLGVDIDALGISIVQVRGKTNLDLFWHLYRAHEIEAFVVFDNDLHKQDNDRAWNRVLTRMLGSPETDSPHPCTARNHAILDGDYERSMKRALDAAEPGLYDALRTQASAELGESKPLQARAMAGRLVEREMIPGFVADIVEAVRKLATGEVADDVWD